MKKVAVDSKKKSNNKFKYIIFSIIFFLVGLSIGVVGASRYLSSKDKEAEKTVTESGPLDITEDKDYQATIEKLLKIMNKNVAFYKSTGLSMGTMSNDTKVKLVYDYLLSNNKVFDEKLDAVSWTATVCNYDFLTEYASNADGTTYNTGYCNIQRINLSDINTTYQELFNDNTINLYEPVFIASGKKCVTEGESFLCGKVQDFTGVTGSLDSKFEVIKVTKDDEGTIKIYEKGYLVDTRSNIVNPNDGYDNYYLHSSDSNAYYYELRSADNLTFIHTFKLNEKNNYYYLYTVLEK